jgi:hypothetical protein
MCCSQFAYSKVIEEEKLQESSLCLTDDLLAVMELHFRWQEVVRCEGWKEITTISHDEWLGIYGFQGIVKQCERLVVRKDGELVAGTRNWPKLQKLGPHRWID